MGKSLLTLETLEPDRDFIEIDGKPYPIRGSDELTLPELARIRRVALGLKDGLGEGSNDAATGAESFADEVLKTILIGLTDDVLRKLTSTQKFRIVAVFTQLGAKRTAEEAPTESPRTGDASSPDSAASTEVH